MPNGETVLYNDVWFGGVSVEGVVFPIEHRSNYGDYCGRRRFAIVRKSHPESLKSGALSPASVASDREKEIITYFFGSSSTFFDPPSEKVRIGAPDYTDGFYFTNGYYLGTILATTFLLRANRRTDYETDASPEALYGNIEPDQKVSDGPDKGKPWYEGDKKAIELANRIALDYIGWRVAGSDDYYVGTPYYLFDAHDDTILFDYSVTNGVGMRVCPVPRNHKHEQELLHASEFNCSREILYNYSLKPFAFGANAPKTYARIGRPIYGDGTVGPPCAIASDDYLSSCNDICASFNEE